MFVQLNAHPEVGIAAKKLQSELQRRFKKYTDPNDERHECIFLLGTALDPRYRLLLNPLQLAAAKSQLLKEVRHIYCYKDIVICY